MKSTVISLKLYLSVPLKLPRNNVIPSILETQHDAGFNLYLSLSKYILVLHQDVLATALK